jgi:hypothetical protein
MKIEIEYEELLDFVNALQARTEAFARSSTDWKPMRYAAKPFGSRRPASIASSLTSCSLKRTPR